MIEKFKEIAPQLEKICSGPVHLVRIKGKRVSYIAGHVPTDLSVMVPRRIDIDKEWAILVYANIDDGKVVEIMKILNMT